MSDRNDARLEEDFFALRDEEARRAPDFGPLLASVRAARRARHTRRVRRAGAVLLVAAAAVFAVARTVDRPPAGDLADELLASRGLWRAPTDVLLDRRPVPLWRSTDELFQARFLDEDG